MKWRIAMVTTDNKNNKKSLATPFRLVTSKFKLTFCTSLFTHARPHCNHQTMDSLDEPIHVIIRLPYPRPEGFVDSQPVRSSNYLSDYVRFCTNEGNS